MNKEDKNNIPMYPMMYYGTYPMPVPPQFMQYMGFQSGGNASMQMPISNMPLHSFPNQGYMPMPSVMPQSYFGLGGFPEEIEPEIEPDSK